jgi:AcrR family transcriptional regulator
VSTQPATVQVVSRRERARAATIEEIKDTALRLMHEQGTTDIRFSDIARLMGMTAPALYRYFADRDELLAALMVDAYDSLGQAVAVARDAVDPSDYTGRLLAVGNAYRTWARAERERFALILGMPVPGFVPPEEGETTEAMRRAMTQLKSLFVEAAKRGELGPPAVHEVSTDLLDCLLGQQHLGDATEDDKLLTPANFQACLHVWSALHGFTSLEAYGHLDWLTSEARDSVFRSLVLFLARSAGLPVSGQAAGTTA